MAIKTAGHSDAIDETFDPGNQSNFRGDGAPGQLPEATVNFRAIDGANNNLGNQSFNATNTDFARIGEANFADGISSLVDGPNPRTISNVVVGEGDAAVPNQEGLSGFMYAWGQFIDHDLDLARSDGTTHIDVQIPAGDPNFPDGSSISITRAVIDPATGQGTSHPATAMNSITGWLDASMVYGSDAQTAASLRLPDGHLKSSAGGNLPIVDGAFLAGDVRVAENPSLTALQTLFLREHNYQVDLLHEQHPGWTGDQLYNQAKAIVNAEIAHITYSEFLPHLIGPDALSAYQGYDPSVDPRITLEFAGAAFRFGHSIVSAETDRIDNFGAGTGPALELKDTFFMTPEAFASDGGADGFLRHLASDASQAMDSRIVDDLRNFLFDSPVSMDLAAINIERGRDLGLPTLNETREALGLTAYSDFAQITNDQATVAALEKAFGSVDKIDLWTGGLSESHAEGAMVGQTFQEIIARQFENLRDGDRFWYQRQGFDAGTLSNIEHTTLSDIIERDTDTKVMQDDAFVFTSRHSGTLGGVTSDNPDAPQLVIGSKGTDTLVGGPQNDILVAAQGHQTLTGLAGNDQFVFNVKGIKATITDFDPSHDVLVFEHLGKIDFPSDHRDDWWMAASHDHHSGFQVQSDHHGNTVIHAAGDTIVLNNVDPHELNAANFLLHT
jgi:heme peroxidase/hemolysin type calcium-binding protein